MSAWLAGPDADALLVVTERRETPREDATSDASLWLNALEDVLGLPVPAGLVHRPLPPEYVRARAIVDLPIAPTDCDQATNESQRALVRIVFERVDAIAAAAALAHELCARFERKPADA